MKLFQLTVLFGALFLSTNCSKDLASIDPVDVNSSASAVEAGVVVEDLESWQDSIDTYIELKNSIVNEKSRAVADQKIKEFQDSLTASTLEYLEQQEAKIEETKAAIAELEQSGSGGDALAALQVELLKLQDETASVRTEFGNGVAGDPFANPALVQLADLKTVQDSIAYWEDLKTTYPENAEKYDEFIAPLTLELAALSVKYVAEHDSVVIAETEKIEALKASGAPASEIAAAEAALEKLVVAQSEAEDAVAEYIPEELSSAQTSAASDASSATAVDPISSDVLLSSADGGVTLSSDGSVQVSSVAGVLSSAVVALSSAVASVNTAPYFDVTSPVVVTVAEDSSVVIAIVGTDDEGDVLTWSQSLLPNHGTSVLGGSLNNRTITYTPTANYVGSDSIVVSITDGAFTVKATLKITVTPVDDPTVYSGSPVIDAATAEVDTELSVTPGVCTDIDNAETYSYSWYRDADNTAGGGIAIDGATSTTYGLVVADNGQYIYVVVTCNGIEKTTAYSELVTTNVAPVIAEGTSVAATIQEDDDNGAGLIGYTITAADDDGIAGLTWSLIAPLPANGTATVTGNGVASPTVTYAPTADVNGVDSIFIAVSDGTKSDTIKVAITITPVEDNEVYTATPLLSGQEYVGGVLMIDSAGTCTDADGPASLSYVWFRDAASSGNNETTQVGTGTSYTVQALDEGNYIFGKAICDGTDGAATARYSAYTAVITSVATVVLINDFSTAITAINDTTDSYLFNGFGMHVVSTNSYRNETVNSHWWYVDGNAISTLTMGVPDLTTMTKFYWELTEGNIGGREDYFDLEVFADSTWHTTNLEDHGALTGNTNPETIVITIVDAFPGVTGAAIDSVRLVHTGANSQSWMHNFEARNK